MSSSRRPDIATHFFVVVAVVVTVESLNLIELENGENLFATAASCYQPKWRFVLMSAPAPGGLVECTLNISLIDSSSRVLNQLVEEERNTCRAILVGQKPFSDPFI